jgi:hypothetical protein
MHWVLPTDEVLEGFSVLEEERRRALDRKRRREDFGTRLRKLANQFQRSS